MNVLLNVTPRELQQLSGDVSYYQNLLQAPARKLQFRTVNGGGALRREIRKGFERLNRRSWPQPLRRALFRRARLSFVAPSNLAGVDLMLSHIVFPEGTNGDVPVVWSSQGISPAFYYDAVGAPTHADVVDLYNHFGNQAALVLIWTESGARAVRQHCSLHTPIAVLPPVLTIHPVPPTVCFPAKRAGCQFLFVGRDPQRKGLFELMQAYRAVVAQGADVALDIVSRLAPSVEQELRGLSGVTYYTNVTDDQVAALMQRADVLVLATHAETYGFVLIEAMARRCALVASDYEPLNELVGPGKNGLVVPPGDVEALTKALGLLARRPDLVRQFAENSWQKYQQEFAVERLVPRYVETLQQVLQEWRSRRSAS